MIRDSSPPPLPHSAHQTLGEDAYDYLAHLLVSGSVAPGERLSLRDIAATLNVSVMPIRAAVSRLVADQALEVAPKRAVRVPITTASGFLALAETRAAIEGFATTRAAVNRSAEELELIRKAEARYRRLAEQSNPNPKLSIQANYELHFAIYRASGLPPLQEIIFGLWLKAGPMLNLDLREHPERLLHGRGLANHAEALRSIEQRDGARASAAVAADILDAADFIVKSGCLPA